MIFIMYSVIHHDSTHSPANTSIVMPVRGVLIGAAGCGGPCGAGAGAVLVLVDACLLRRATKSGPGGSQPAELLRRAS